MIYINENGQLFHTDETELINVYGYLAEIRLYKGENPLKINRGVDYKGVLNGEVFLKDSVENCTKNYTTKFKNVELGDVTQVGEIVSMPVKVTRFDNETMELNIGTKVNG